MNKLILVSVICLIGIGINGCSESEDPPPQAEKVVWGYEAENGADVWGRLSPDFSFMC